MKTRVRCWCGATHSSRSPVKGDGWHLYRVRRTNRLRRKNRRIAKKLRHRSVRRFGKRLGHEMMEGS